MVWAVGWVEVARMVLDEGKELVKEHLVIELAGMKDGEMVLG